MDSFFSLFDPTDGVSSTDNSLDTVKKKGDAPKGRRRGRRSQVKNETLPEESSFLCEPDLSSELLVKEGSYIESFFESPKQSDDPKDADSKPKRRNSARKSRRKKSKVSPAKELLPSSSWSELEPPPLNNKNSRSADKRVNVGKNVNNLQECDIDSPEYMRKSRRKAEPFDADDVYCAPAATDVYCAPAATDVYCAPAATDDSQVYNVIDQLERVSLSSDEFTAYSELTADCDEPGDDGDYEDSASQLSDSSEECYGSLPPEPRFGNVEYKLQLLSPSEARFQHLVTQLKWRLGSGGGTARYVLGVRDAGAVRGLRPRALRASLHTLRRMATALGASVTVTARRVAPHRAVAEAVLKKMAETQQSVELRVAVMGANEAGKSTLIGVLTQGELDNGRGSARLNMFRHVHEVRSGRTSSLSHEILGFDAQGNVVNYGCSELMTAERIGERSAKLVSFLDLAGHSKYQRTTVHGLTGYRPHYSMLLVSAVAGITSITEAHLSLLLALELPFFVVLTKSELAPPRAVDEALSGLAALLGDAGKKPLLISDENLARTCVHPQTLIHHIRAGERPAPDDGPALECVPVFPVSCVRGSGLAALHAYLLALQPPPSELELLEEEPCEFQIDEVFHMDAASGPVVGGLQARGRLRETDHLLIGPLKTGEFVPITVKSIYRNRAPTQLVRAGQSASLRLGARPAGLRGGMVLLAAPRVRRARVAPTYPHCAPGKCKSRALHIIANQQSPDKKKNTKNERRKEKNLLKDIEMAHNSLQKETDAGVAGNIYRSEESEDEAAAGASETECVCTDKVYLEDPNNPRGCLYFQATIHLQKHSAEFIYPGFQCTVHIGNVRQTALIEGLLTATGSLRTGGSASALLRFARAPEHVRAGARLLCRAGERTRAVGRVTQPFPYRPPATDDRSDEDAENDNYST